MHREIYEELQRVAREQDVTTYEPIAQLADLDMRRQEDRNEIGRLLGEISTYEHEQGRPLLSAVVHLQEQNRPGVGFFTLARQLGLLQADGDEDAFWNDEVRRVWQAWLQAG